MKKWDQRWFKVTTVQIGAAPTAFIEWHKNSAGTSAKGSFCLSGSTLASVAGKDETQYRLQLRPTEQNKQEHELILRASGHGSSSDSEFANLLQVLQVWAGRPAGDSAISAHSTARSSADSRMQLHPPQVEGPHADTATDATAKPKLVGSRAQFARAVVAAATDGGSGGAAIDRLLSAMASNAGVALCTRHCALSVPDDADTMGLRLEPCTAGPSSAVQVKDVVATGLAALQGIRPGFVVQDINGISVAGAATLL